jgi:hypothetical protein
VEYEARVKAASEAEAQRQASEAERRRQAEEKVAAKAAAVRAAELREHWLGLTPGQREAITARVKAENPGLRRWKSMIEPLCLAELERLLGAGEPIPVGTTQATLFEK